MKKTLIALIVMMLACVAVHGQSAKAVINRPAPTYPPVARPTTYPASCGCPKGPTRSGNSSGTISLPLNDFIKVLNSKPKKVKTTK